MSMRIGILGGTFNPIHYGHLRLGIEVMERTGLDKIILVPNYLPPHKAAPRVSAQDRLAMCSLAAQSCPSFMVNDYEISKGHLSYTIETIEHLQKLYPEAIFSFITGADSLVKSVWHRLDYILERLEAFYVVNRPGITIDELQEKLEELKLLQLEKVIWIDAPGLDISSTHIRDYLAQRRSVKFLLPDSVLEYIRLRQLFVE